MLDKRCLSFSEKGKEIAHFGLSYLYKLPYTYSVKDGLPPAHSDSRKDLAKTIFGCITKNEALKGRVQFSHFKAVSNINELDSITEILGTPRASYYPMYVKQRDGKLFSTFMDGDFSISGWKRYPVHSGAGVMHATDTGNENVGTTFNPLKEGVVFRGKLRYHNLKKAELGALLSALTFHQTEGCFHNIGMAKALGYGKIAVKLDGVENAEAYLKSFEAEVSEQVEDWAESEQLQELLSMAAEQRNSGNSKLKYMELKQFASNKTGDDKDYLRNYTALQNIQSVTVKSLITQEDLEALRVKQAERKEQERQHKEKKKKEAHHKKEWDVVWESTTLATIEAFIEKYPGSPYLKTAIEKIEKLKADVLAEEAEIKEKSAQAKWEAVQKQEDKHKQKALEDFIRNYADSKFVSEAQKALNDLGKKAQKPAGKSISDLTSVQDGKRFKSILEELTISEADKTTIKKFAIEVYSKLKGKKQKNFFKEAQLGRFVGQDFENEIKNAL